MLVEVRSLRLFVVIPLGGAVDVDGEDAAVGSLDGEGLRRGGGIDDTGDELIDVGACVAGAYGVDLERRRHVAGDLSVGHLDGFIEAEIHM